MSDNQNKNNRTFWFWLSVIINIGFLGIFKYYNFFADSFAFALERLGFHVNPYTIQVILPVGISFYTFHGLSYVIDIYKRKISAERNFVDYAVFVSFFPLLVAGPIERATHLLPQIKQNRIFSGAKATDGLRQILWGLFKKVVIADNAAEFANLIFNAPTAPTGSNALIAAAFFTFQIYGDFSGYSDIALGTARLFGIDLLRNFAYPYFSRDIAEFWRRWHISLSSWFKDYLYIPLGGSQRGQLHKIRNTVVIFLVSGFWHGANWTFIVWGLLNALYIMPSVIFDTNRNHLDIVAKDRFLPNFKELWQILTTFSLTVVAWIFFRAADLNQAFTLISAIFSKTIFIFPTLLKNKNAVIALALIVFCMGMEWLGRTEQHALARLGVSWKRPLRWTLYYGIIALIFWRSGHSQQFIYFQF